MTSKDCVDAEHFDRAMGMLLDRVQALEGRQMDADAMTEAFVAGMRKAAADPQLMSAALDQLSASVQRRAAEQAGRTMGALLKSLVTKWLVIGFIVLMVAKTAGLDVAGKVWTVLKGA